MLPLQCILVWFSRQSVCPITKRALILEEQLLYALFCPFLSPQYLHRYFKVVKVKPRHFQYLTMTTIQYNGKTDYYCGHPQYMTSFILPVTILILILLVLELLISSICKVEVVWSFFRGIDQLVFI